MDKDRTESRGCAFPFRSCGRCYKRVICSLKKCIQCPSVKITLRLSQLSMDMWAFVLRVGLVGSAERLLCS